MAMLQYLAALEKLERLRRPAALVDLGCSGTRARPQAHENTQPEGGVAEDTRSANDGGRPVAAPPGIADNFALPCPSKRFMRTERSEAAGPAPSVCVPVGLG